VPSAVAEDFRVVVTPVRAPGAPRRRWCASARISGSRDGAPFTMVLDLYAHAFDTEAQAVRYGALKAEARLQQLIERRALP
jgi:hypothetical protein